MNRLMRATSERGTANIDTAVTQRLLDTYARMAGDEDSYVYLAAVQGLASLADALPGWCIPRLVGLFAALPTAAAAAATSKSPATTPTPQELPSSSSSSSPCFVSSLPTVDTIPLSLSQVCYWRGVVFVCKHYCLYVVFNKQGFHSFFFFHPAI